MKGFPESNCDSSHNSIKKRLSFSNSSKEFPVSVSSEAEPSTDYSKHQKSAEFWPGIWPPSLSIFGSLSSSQGTSESKSCTNCYSVRKKSASGRNYYEGWRAALRRAMMNGGSMRRILGFNRTSTSTSNSDIWLLGVCYCVALEGDDANSSNPTQSEGFAAFVEDFSSRILITYRRGFTPIGDTKYTSDVNWGCMLRSSQMLIAQAFLFHKLGRSWRKSADKPLDQSYIEILHLFGDAEDSPCSIHNLLQAGKAYGLAPGSWVGPYAMCRTWESLVWNTDRGVLFSTMGLYVVSGDEDGERGGAPVLCIEDISRHCFEFSQGQADWGPIILMVPLVLGLDKLNPRYIPLLTATFTFPQSLGILGGRPGASTYIVGMQDENAFYLDPHEVQQVVNINTDNADVDTSSYHCNVVRNIPLDSIDPSLAIGFYCRDKSDFDDLCVRASELIDRSDGAPLFTIAQTRSCPKPSTNRTATESQDCDPTDGLPMEEAEDFGQEDEWQLL